MTRRSRTPAPSVVGMPRSASATRRSSSATMCGADDAAGCSEPLQPRRPAPARAPARARNVRRPCTIGRTTKVARVSGCYLYSPVFSEAFACAWFLVSGASALALETLWFEKAGLVFGNDVWASSAVLSAFMLGMAGGHVAAARWAGKVKGLRTFALLEATAGIAGVALVFGLASAESGFASIA